MTNYVDKPSRSKSEEGRDDGYDGVAETLTQWAQVLQTVDVVAVAGAEPVHPPPLLVQDGLEEPATRFQGLTGGNINVDTCLKYTLL